MCDGTAARTAACDAVGLPIAALSKHLFSKASAAQNAARLTDSGARLGTLCPAHAFALTHFCMIPVTPSNNKLLLPQRDPLEVLARWTAARKHRERRQLAM
jgi:hypothetical protein